MTETVEDLDGKQVGVGDRIAYAATDGRSSGLRVGTVLEVVQAHKKDHIVRGELYWSTDVPTKLRVSVESSSGYGTPSKPTLIEASFKRFVKLGN